MQASTAVSTVGAGSFYLLARFAVGFFVWSFLENLEAIILLIFIVFRVDVDGSACLSGDHFFGFDVKSDVSARVGMACMLCIPLSQSQHYVRHSPGWCAGTNLITPHTKFPWTASAGSSANLLTMMRVFLRFVGLFLGA